MDLTPENAAELAQQLQDAHRYAAGFYQRFLPMMNAAAESHGFEPERWHSARFNNPPMQQPTPEKKWAWDLLPMCYTRFRFTKKQERHAVLEITFTPDPELKLPGYPDPIKMNSEAPSITITVWSSDNSQPIETDIDILWKASSKEQSITTNQLTRYNSGLLKAQSTVALADFMLQPEVIILEALNYLPT